MHKSGGSLTQSALAHLPNGSRIDPAVFQQALNTLQTTSPSYLLMASLDAACDYLASAKGQDRIDWLMTQVQQLRTSLITKLRTFQLFQPENPLWDPCKLYLTHPSLPGEKWAMALEADQQIAYESASPYGVLYLAGLGLAEDDFEAFQRVLIEEDQRLGVSDPTAAPIQALLEQQNPNILVPETVLLPRDAFFAPGEHCPTKAAIGRVAKETIVHCPPGIPVLLPGERILELHRPFLPKDGLLVVR
jgi:arginine/lysine/ornithine decarboxylase